MTAKRLVLIAMLCAVGIGVRVFNLSGGLKGLSIGTELILLIAILAFSVIALKLVQGKSRRNPPPED
jgi:UDP-N-acetylmuramyl pentapeptide phosphotransferase/UDP-N-acetylglucosamine-1-phosphate transferase